MPFTGFPLYTGVSLFMSLCGGLGEALVWDIAPRHCRQLLAIIIWSKVVVL